jgi:putative aldouronate transport system substrate-binding protein
MADAYVKQSYPSLIFTEEENNELALIGTDIAEYVRQMRAKWVTEGGIDEEWDTYVEQLKAMGLDRFVEIKVNALAR